MSISPKRYVPDGSERTCITGSRSSLCRYCLCANGPAISCLTRHFLQSYATRLHLQEVGLTAEAEQALLAYPWPGNIRELENVIHRALLICKSGTVTAGDLHLPGWHVSPAVTGIPVVPTPVAMSIEPDTPLVIEPSPVPVDELTQFMIAWGKLLSSGLPIDFENLQHELVKEAWETNHRNQVRAAKHLSISRNILRTYLKKAGVLE